MAPRERNLSPTTSSSSNLAHDFGFEIIGYIEEKPGIPPSASHIEKLVEMLRQAKRVPSSRPGFYEKKSARLSLSKKQG